VTGADLASGTVTLTGTGFIPGVTQVHVGGEGIVVKAVVIDHETSARILLAVTPHEGTDIPASIGLRDLTVTNGVASDTLFSALEIVEPPNDPTMPDATVLAGSMLFDLDTVMKQDTLAVPVNIVQGETTLVSINLKVTYDPEILELISIAGGTSPGFEQLIIKANDTSKGEVDIHVRDSGKLADTHILNVANLTFRVLPTMPENTVSLIGISLNPEGLIEEVNGTLRVISLEQIILVGGTVTLGTPNEAVPLIISLSPAGGSQQGGTNVIITGQGFQRGMQVRFGDNLVSSVIVHSSTEVEVVSPSGSGIIDVEVIMPDGQRSLFRSGFTHVAE